VRLIKGESSYWVNKNHLIQGKFEWQDNYMAYSVSDSATVKVRDYIAKQEVHHRIRSFAEEYDEFIKSLG